MKPLVLLLLVACSTGPLPSPPVVDAGDGGADACAMACANLAAIGCEEGGLSCASTCRHAQGAITDLHPACLAAAASKGDARACGSVRCP